VTRHYRHLRAAFIQEESDVGFIAFLYAIGFAVISFMFYTFF